MFAGIMMTAIYKTMEGHLGLAGWRWLFIVLGIITMPVAIFGYIFFPDVPQRSKPFWLSPEEQDLAIARLPPKPPKAEGNHLGWSIIGRVALRPEL